MLPDEVAGHSNRTEEDMTTRIAVAALVALATLSACSKKNETADTTTVPGMDTTKGMAMPTTDTVVKTTTTDTIQGKVADSVARADSIKKASTKTKTGTKTKK